MSRIWIPTEETNATVVEIFPQRARVHWDDVAGKSEAETLCVFRRAAILGKMSDKRSERSPLVVGDRVRADRTGVIDGVTERRNFLARKAPDRDEGQIHVIAANIDRLVIVSSAEEPAFSPGIVDRYWIGAQLASIACELVVNKVDLYQGSAESKPWSVYSSLGLEVTELAAKRDANGIVECIARWKGQTVCFCGHSGVGKTTLLNQLRKLQGSVVDAKTGTVNAFTKKGSHTTSSSVMVWGDVRTIDTPGVRAFAMVGIEAEDLVQFYPEFATLQCAQRSCDHLGREGCQATKLERYDGYRRMHLSITEGEG